MAIICVYINNIIIYMYKWKKTSVTEGLLSQMTITSNNEGQKNPFKAPSFNDVYVYFKSNLNQ